MATTSSMLAFAKLNPSRLGLSPDAQPDARYYLRYLGDPVLQQKAEPINSANEISLSLLASMRKVLETTHGKALAAPQVGASVRIIVVRIGRELKAFINPRIVEASPEVVIHVGEGCLSIPDFSTSVRRHKRVVVAFRDFEFQAHTIVAEGVDACAFQHEIEHLDGILITDKVSRQQRRQAERLVAKHLQRIGGRA